MAREAFLDVAPSIPLTIENYYYEAEPEIISEDSYGWKKTGKQKVKVSGEDYTVQWELNMKVLPPEEEDGTDVKS